MARKKKKSKGKQPYQPMFHVSPALTPITTLSLLVKTPPWRYEFTNPDGSKETALRRFLEVPIVDLDAQRFGHSDDLFEVFRNADHAQHLNGIMRDLFGHMAAKQIPIPERLLVSARLIALAGQTVGSALVLHGRGNPFRELGALSLARTALELAARGGWTAIGTEDEPQRLVAGPKLPTRSERMAAQPKVTECIARIQGEAMQRWREADAQLDTPTHVYDWLCRFTHFDAHAVESLTTRPNELRQDAYCGVAYAAWLAAAMASIVMGQKLASPPRVPAPPPWRP